MRLPVSFVAAVVCLASDAAAQTIEARTAQAVKVAGYVQYDYLAPLGDAAEEHGTFRSVVCDPR